MFVPSTKIRESFGDEPRTIKTPSMPGGRATPGMLPIELREERRARFMAVAERVDDVGAAGGGTQNRQSVGGGRAVTHPHLHPIGR